MDLKYCYHTHTNRCIHAIGTDREYIENAIKKGIKVLGFSDHIFLPEFSQPGFRGDYSLLDEYVGTLTKLKEEYKDRIEIHIGFEAEYADCLVPYYRSLLDSGKIEYLICGQHMFFDAPNDGYGIYQKLSRDEAADKYLETIVKAMASGLYKYIAHPDFFLMRFPKLEGKAEEITKKICEASLKYDIPLEINLQGYNNKPHDCENLWYPTLDFFKYVSEYGCKTIIGLDAHSPNQIFTDRYDELDKIVSAYKLNLIDKIF